MKFLLLTLFLIACIPVAKPNSDQHTYQGSPTVIIAPECKENCGGNTITTGKTEAKNESKNDQAVEQIKKSTGTFVWFLLLIISGVALAGYKLGWFNKNKS